MNWGEAMRRLSRVPEAQREKIVYQMSVQAALDCDVRFEGWAHRNQLPPRGEGWSTWLMMAGRGFGKTRAGAEWISGLAQARPGVRIALVGASLHEARSIMVEGVSGLLAVARTNRKRVKWEPSIGRLTWPNGSEAHLFSGDHPDGLRGPEHDFAWFLTFEVLADEEPPAIGSILTDSSAGAIDSTAAQTVGGYAAYGASIRAAVKPLVETFAVRLFDDGERVREPGTTGLAPIAEAEFGYGLDDERPARARRELDPASALPGEFRLNYYDPARDYQSGEARASVGDETGREVRSELPAVIAADTAKGMAQHLLGRAWARRDRLTLHLPPARLTIEPGTLLELPVTPRDWTVERVVVEGFVPRIELRPYVDEAIAPVVATSGSVSSASDVVEADLAVALVEVPDPTGAQQSPQVLLAASSASAGWPQRSVEIVRGSTTTVVATARRKAILGKSLTALGPGPAHVVDRVNSVDVELVDPAQWLTSCDETALLDGRNLAVLGGELIQFGSVEPLEAGRFRLRTLLRGRYGSEGRASAHAVGESFVLYEPDALVVLPLPPFAIGSVLGAEPAWKGQATAITVTGASLRPPAPVGVWSETQGDGSLAMGWTRRSRMGWAWLDEVDAPLGETLERYRLTVTSASASVEQIATQPSADVPLADLATLGAGPWTISVRQLGDYVSSDAATVIHYPA